MLRTALIVTVSLSAICQATVPCSEDAAPEILVPGLEHLVLCRGETATSTGYRILIATFDRQSEADAMLARLVSGGFSAFPESEGEGYSIVTPAYSERREAEAVRRRLVEWGLPQPLEIQDLDRDPNSAAGPWRIHVLVADPEKVQVKVAHALDAAIGLETTPDLAMRRGAAAAANGGYYRMKGVLAGDAQGVLKIDGSLLSEPDRGRAAVGFFDHDGAVRTVFGRLSFRGAVHLADGTAIPVDGIDRHRMVSEVVVYTPEFHRTTLTDPNGVEVVIQSGRVIEIRENVGSSVIPGDGMVLSIGNERAGGVVPRLRRGANVTLELDLVPLLPDPDGEWRKTEFIVGGGPLLLWQGHRFDEPEKESISRVFFRARHPRTAVGVREDGTLLVVTVDGRQPGVSVGMSIPELTDLMLELGSTSAVNLDGGGSTTMVVAGRLVNTPTDADGARRIGDAILLFSRPEQKSIAGGESSP